MIIDPHVGFSTSRKRHLASLQTERTIAGLFLSGSHPFIAEELSYSNRSSDLSFSIDSDNKASQELGASFHDNRSPRRPGFGPITLAILLQPPPHSKQFKKHALNFHGT